MTERYQPPSFSHPMGTDALGRDLITRVLYGGQGFTCSWILGDANHIGDWRASRGDCRLFRWAGG